MDTRDKAYELYERYLKGYLLITDTITARVKSKECSTMVCDEMIDELNTFGDSNNSFYTIEFWEKVKQETNNI